MGSVCAEQLLTRLSHRTMTYGQVLESRGSVKGLQEGMQQEKLAIASNMLHKLHLGVEVVEQATGLTKQELDCL